MTFFFLSAQSLYEVSTTARLLTLYICMALIIGLAKIEILAKINIPRSESLFRCTKPNRGHHSPASVLRLNSMVDDA